MMQILTPKADGMASGDPHPDGKATIFGVQALRFIAAAMVVMTHALNREVAVYNPAPLPRAGWLEAGVDIFFVISGFIMVYIVKPETRPGAFWLQRFTRIVPLYWVATAVAFVGGLVLPEWFFGQAHAWFALQSALFVPLGPDAGTHPLISPGWTLVYEFAFYSLLAVCLLLRRSPFALATVVIVLVVSAGPLLKPVLPWFGWYSDQAMMVEFLLGMAAAVLVREHAFRPWQGLAMAGAGFVLIFLLWEASTGWPRGLRIGLPAFLVVLGFLVSEPLWRHAALRRFARLGDASYSIYLVHFFLVTAITTAFEKFAVLRDACGPLVFVGLMVGVGIGGGIVAHVLIEKPLLEAVRSWLPGRRRAAIVAPANG